MPGLLSGGVLHNEYGKGRANVGLLSVDVPIVPSIIYLGLWTVPAKIVEVTTSPFAKGRVLTLNVDEDVLRRKQSLLVSGDLLYAGTIWPATVVKVDRINMTRLAALVLDTASDVDIYALCIVGNYLYAGFRTSPGRIDKVDLTTFTKVATLTFQSGENYVWGLATSGGYLYALCGVDPTLIVKVDLTTFTRVGVLNLTQATFRYRWGAPLLTHAEYLYAGATTTWPTNNPNLAKIDLSTFLKVDETGGYDYEYMYDLAWAGDYLYAALQQNYNQINKVQVSPMSILASLKLPITGLTSAATACVSDGSYLYVTTDVARKITRINLATFTAIDEIYISEGQPWALAVS